MAMNAHAEVPGMCRRIHVIFREQRHGARGGVAGRRYLHRGNLIPYMVDDVRASVYPPVSAPPAPRQNKEIMYGYTGDSV